MTQQQVYERVNVYDGFEVRRYAPCVVAEVLMTGSFERAGNAGFGPLVSYISGRNQTGGKVAMTAPVIQEQIADSDLHRVQFVMPAGSSMSSLPAPATQGLRLIEVPEQTAAVMRYSGRWSEAAYRQHVAELTERVQRAGLRVVGSARLARFDPPWKPGFLRRNEVVLPVEPA